MGMVGTAHEALRPMGITPDRIRFTWPDTSKTPNSGPSGIASAGVDRQRNQDRLF